MGEAQSLTTGPAKRPMRVVIDTNVVLSALVFKGRLGWLRGAWARRDVVPVMCRETTAELLRVLGYPKFRLTAAEQETLLADYLPFAEVAALPEPPPELPVACRDHDDTIFIQLAMAASADCLVSGDADVAVLRALVPIRIVSAHELKISVENL